MEKGIGYSHIFGSRTLPSSNLQLPFSLEVLVKQTSKNKTYLSIELYEFYYFVLKLKKKSNIIVR
jgi:hypothetical protein